MRELGELMGWMTVFLFMATLMNFVLKYMNKNYAKAINAVPLAKKFMPLFMKIFVRNHRLWGALAVLSLLTHFYIQYSNYGVSISGAIAGSLMLSQLALGMYGAFVKKKRQGLWFHSHRAVSVVIILGILMHLG